MINLAPLDSKDTFPCAGMNTYSMTSGVGKVGHKAITQVISVSWRTGRLPVEWKKVDIT